jgi:hypothetical protein
MLKSVRRRRNGQRTDGLKLGLDRAGVGTNLWPDDCKRTLRIRAQSQVIPGRLISHDQKPLLVEPELTGSPCDRLRPIAVLKLGRKRECHPLDDQDLSRPTHSKEWVGGRSLQISVG